MEKDFQRKNFPSKLFFGLRRRWHFRNPPWKNFWQPTTRWKFFAYCPKTIRKKGFSNKVLPQFFPLDSVGEWSIGDPGKNFLPFGCCILAHGPKKWKKKFSIRQTYSKLSNWTSKTQFWQLHRVNSARRPKIFTSMSGKDEKVFEATLFFSFAPMVNNMQFWQPHRNVPANKPKKFKSRSEVNWKKN